MGIRILNGGFLTTVQDMGRYGSQETGMAVSGVMDTGLRHWRTFWWETMKTRRSWK